MIVPFQEGLFIIIESRQCALSGLYFTPWRYLRTSPWAEPARLFRAEAQTNYLETVPGFVAVMFHFDQVWTFGRLDV